MQNKFFYGSSICKMLHASTNFSNLLTLILDERLYLTEFF